MKRLKGIQTLIQGLMAIALSMALPLGSWATITNTASATYQDLAGNNYNASSLQVVIVTPPIVTAPAALTLDVGVAMTPVQVAATNAPTGFTLTGAPNGISISNTGLISGTPAPASAGPYSVTVTANNAAGPGTATFSITVRGAATVLLTKTANVTHAQSGDTVTFTIGYQNTGAGPASSVVITDVIPTGSTYVANSASSGGSFNSGTNTVTWTIGGIAAGASSSVTFQVTVN